MRIDELPAADRAAIRAGRTRAPRPSPRRARRPDSVTTAAPTDARRARYRCNTCGELFARYRPAERHADEHGGARIDLVLAAAS